MRRACALMLTVASAACADDGLLAENTPGGRVDAGFFRVDAGPDAGPRPDARPIEPRDAGPTAPDAEPPIRCECPVLPASCPALTTDQPAFSPGAELTRQILDVVACSDTVLQIAMYETDWDCLVTGLVDKLAADSDLRVELVIDDQQCPLDPGGTRLCALARLHGHPRVSIVDDARTRYMHHKFMVADDRTVWTGSSNFTRASLCSELNDGIIIGDPTIIGAFAAEFDLLYTAREFGPRRSSDPVTGGPYTVYFGPQTPVSAPSPWFAEMIDAIDTASISVAVMTAAWTRTEVSDALMRAARRGLDVRAIVPHHYQDEPPAQALVAAGLPVRVARVHHKLMIIDERTVITGSPNWSENSWANNEASVWIRDLATARRYRARFEAAFADASPPP